MKRSHTLGTSLCLLALLPSLPGSAPPPQGELRPTDHKTLGKEIEDYLEAWRKNKGLDKARESVASQMEKLGKKVKDRDPLSLTTDLGLSLWESMSYASAKGVRKGSVKPIPYEEKDIDLEFEYATWAPSRYDPKKAYPLILCIPEKGEKPTDHLTEKWTSSDVRDNAILAAVPMPEDASMWSEVGSRGNWGGGANLFTVFREVSRTYGTDFDRVYIAGRGEGVDAAMAIASRNADRFAGVIGRTGDPGEIRCENFRNLPTFFAGAGAGASTFAEACTKAGYDNCTIKPEGKEEDVWAWIQDHPRIANPSDIVLLPGTPLPYKAYWLQIPPWDGQGTALVKASIDRASNTVTVDGEGVVEVTLYFNDLLVDLEKPVKIVCNGTEHVDVIPRSLATFLELIVNARSDPGKLYVARKSYDLPAKPK